MSTNKQIPHEEGLDHSISLMKEGYLYILNRRQQFNSNIFETRLLGKKTICMGGKEAAEVFYDADKFKRKNAAPNRAVQTLFGQNGVQMLDDAAHRHRKEMFMSVMSPDKLKSMLEITEKQWKQAIAKWIRMDEVILYEEAQEIMCRSVCEWVGVPVEEDKIKQLTKDLVAMYESPAEIGPAHWQGRHARNREEKWVGELVERIRDKKLSPQEDTILYKFVWHRDLDGNLLDTETVAVEILNVLRPFVAISVYIAYIALSVHQYPNEREKLISDDGDYAHMFIQEVRRFYPFFPFAGALVKKDFTWNGYLLEEDTLTLLDLYGTNHDPELWENPDTFNPERFANFKDDGFTLIPQGGGDHLFGHRCAGEWVTIEVMKISLDYIAKRIDYDIPDQDLRFSMVSMPSVPNSEVVLKNVRWR